MPVSAGRRLAFRALGEARRSGRWVRDALRAVAERSDASDQDRALAWRLAMGTTAAKGLLEERIRSFARRPSSIQPQVLDALKLTAFELLYLETPIPVTVNEGVELVRSVAPKAASFANAILRKLAPLREEIHAARTRMAEGSETEEDLLLVSALPHWLLNELKKSLTPAQLKSFSLCTLTPAPQWTIEVGKPDLGTGESTLNTYVMGCGRTEEKALNTCRREVGGEGVSSVEQGPSTCGSGLGSVGISSAEQDLPTCRREVGSHGISSDEKGVPTCRRKPSSAVHADATDAVEAPDGMYGGARFATTDGRRGQPGYDSQTDAHAAIPRDGRRDQLGSDSRTDGHASIHMDLAAQTIARLTVPPTEGSRLEIGMGRGTKMLVVAHTLAEVGEQAELVGVDPDARRLHWARDEFAALGYDVTTYQADGRALDEVPELRDRKFDLVFLDAPCTGTGTLRRHPEIAWSLTPSALAKDDPKSLVNLQAELLAAASRHVAKGGHLAYSTCSVLKEENAAQIGTFLASEEGRAFARADIRETKGFELLPEDSKSFVIQSLTPEGAFATSPSDSHPDGHYLAFLQN